MNTENQPTCSEPECTELANFSYVERGRTKFCCGVHYHSVHSGFVALGLAGNVFGQDQITFTPIRAYQPDNFIDWERIARETQAASVALATEHDALKTAHAAALARLDYLEKNHIPALVRHAQTLHGKRTELPERAKNRPRQVQKPTPRQIAYQKTRGKAAKPADEQGPATRP